ncbi:MAG: methionyl-tRNA formyltransferase [Candidatus Acidiferrales bacterium]
MAEQTYIVAGCKPWNRRVFEEQISKLPGQWHFIGAPEELSIEKVDALHPRYIFFLHWSQKVQEKLVRNQECVCFHMTDVPYGRGGSPLQNLIVRGHRETKLTALRMSEEFDAGPVYVKRALSLDGNAEEIYIRSSNLAAKMIGDIIRDELQPTPQTGEPVVFRRRKPAESEIPPNLSLEGLYDFIRMLDAQGYPRAFLLHGNFRCEFSRAVLYDREIRADVSIRLVKSNSAHEDSRNSCASR